MSNFRQYTELLTPGFFIGLRLVLSVIEISSMP